MLVVVVDEGIDLALEVVHGLERTAADRLVGDQCEPSLDLIEPGTVGGREVHMEPRPPRQPGMYPRMLAGRVVVADQVDVESGRHVGFDVAQEGQELLTAMLGLALRQHAAIGNVQRREESGRAMVDVVVRDAFDVAQPSGRTGWVRSSA